MKLRSLITLTSLFALGACALPNAGPSASAISNTKGVDVVNLTPDQVALMATEAKAEHDKRLSDAINALMSTEITSIDHQLSIGDMVSVNLWTFSPWPGQSESSNPTGGPTQVKMGDFQIAADGTVDLPYAHKVRIAGLSYAQAQDTISRRYIGLGILQNPAVTVQSSESALKFGDGGEDGILVTGQIGKPRSIPWSPGGMTMAKALTLAMGDGTTTLQQQNGDESNNESAISVNVSRHGHRVATIPMNEALEQDIPLRPSDHLIVRKQSNVRVTVMGGGITKNGLYGFAEQPTVAEVIASAQGINPNTADATKMFIFRVVNSKPTLYQFAWNKGASIFAAQQFPVKDRDIVYVAESGMVPIERFLSILVQMGVFASIAR